MPGRFAERRPPGGERGKTGGSRSIVNSHSDRSCEQTCELWQSTQTPTPFLVAQAFLADLLNSPRVRMGRNPQDSEQFSSSKRLLTLERYCKILGYVFNCRHRVFSLCRLLETTLVPERTKHPTTVNQGKALDCGCTLETPPGSVSQRQPGGGVACCPFPLTGIWEMFAQTLCLCVQMSFKKVKATCTPFYAAIYISAPVGFGRSWHPGALPQLMRRA